MEQQKIRVDSLFTDKLITPANKLAELMCLRMAKRANQELDWQFWKNDMWAKIFREQTTAAANLLRQFPFQAVLSAFEKNPKTYSFRGSWLIPLIDREAKLLAKRQQIEQSKPEVVIEESHPIFKAPERKSKLSRLD